MGVNRSEFADAVLKKLGAPATTQNKAFLVAWMAREGTKACYNPFATTLKTPGVVGNFNHNNGYPVKNYGTFEDGVSASAKTLQGKRYAAVMTALKSGNGASCLNPDNYAAFGAYCGGGDGEKGIQKGKEYADLMKKLYGQALAGQHDKPVGTNPQAGSGSKGDAPSGSGTPNQFVMGEGTVGTYSPFPPSSLEADMAKTRQSLVIQQGLNIPAWYQDKEAVTGNPNLKNVKPVWFQINLAPGNPMKDVDGNPVELRLNCSLSEMSLAMRHKYAKTPTRTGMHIVLWGMEADTITGSGSTGAWMNQLGLTQVMSSERLTDQLKKFADSQGRPEAFEKFQFFKQFQKGYKPGTPPEPSYRVAAQDAFAELIALFKYNAVTRFRNDGYTGFFTDRDQMGDNLWSEQFGGSTFIAGARNNDVMHRGTVLMGTRDDLYAGYFKTLSFTEDSEKPYRWNFNFTFQVQGKVRYSGVPKG